LSIKRPREIFKCEIFTSIHVSKLSHQVRKVKIQQKLAKDIEWCGRGLSGRGHLPLIDGNLGRVYRDCWASRLADEDAVRMWHNWGRHGRLVWTNRWAGYTCPSVGHASSVQ